MDVETATAHTRDSVAKFLRPAFKFCIIGEEGDSTWESPETTCIKINCDGSWVSFSTRMGFGCVARYIAGLFIVVRASFLEHGDLAQKQKAFPSSMLCDGLRMQGGICVFLRRIAVNSSIFS